MVEAINFVPTRTRTVGETKQLLTPADYKEGMGIADLIRLCKQQHPNESNGNISRFLTEFTGRYVRPQWVYNVLHTELKRK